VTLVSSFAEGTFRIDFLRDIALLVLLLTALRRSDMFIAKQRSK
jgi:hypothetical protein